MKLSNFWLGFVAASLLAASTVAVIKLTSVTPTAVISIPLSDGVRGGGASMEVPRDLSSRQVKLLAMAYEIAKRDGHKHPQLLQGIILQETKAGGMQSYRVAGQEFGLEANRRYYGVAQLKLAAARDVLKRHPELWDEFDFQTRTDEEVIAALIKDDHFNLSVASKYLLVLRGHGYNTLAQLALAYNQGPTGARRHDPATHSYSVKVMRHIQELPARPAARRDRPS